MEELANINDFIVNDINVDNILIDNTFFFDPNDLDFTGQIPIEYNLMGGEGGSVYNGPIPPFRYHSAGVLFNFVLDFIPLFSLVMYIYRENNALFYAKISD
jgi:hypothetical protein